MAPLNRYQAPSKLVPGLYELDTPADEVSVLALMANGWGPLTRLCFVHSMT